MAAACSISMNVPGHGETGPCCRTRSARFLNHVVKPCINAIIHYLVNPVIDLINWQNCCHLRRIEELLIHEVNIGSTEVAGEERVNQPAVLEGYRCLETGEYYPSLEDYLASGGDDESDQAIKPLFAGCSNNHKQYLNLAIARYKIERLKRSVERQYEFDQYNCEYKKNLGPREYSFIRIMSPLINDVFRCCLEIVAYLDVCFPESNDGDFKKSAKYFVGRGNGFIVPRHENPQAMYARIPYVVANLSMHIAPIKKALASV
ncbi:hypothetical protein [Kistimonas asteriae]|uniref:hypothetical protein n=1 Tax=Kistimonas asteriae TaxID=517724 RepID=UPI001BA69325|nr:hypothetical protein [Kistimonas asteriae]